MDELDKLFEQNYAQHLLEATQREPKLTAPVDLSRAAQVSVTRDMYVEAQAKGLTLSELLESDEYDPSPLACPLDAFERQLAVKGIKVGGPNPSTVELFFSTAPTLLPEFMLREIKRGQKMRPGLADLGATSTVINANRYTPFFVSGTPTQPKFSLRPIGDGAEVPKLVVAEQLHTITIPDYGMALEVSYKALRHRTTAQFKVLLWYVGFRLQADKMGLVVNTIVNGDGNANPATVLNTAATGVLTYADLITFWAEFFPYELNVVLCHKDKLKSILTLPEFKDPMAGFKFQRTGEVVSPLGSKLIRSDDVPNDLVIGLDSRFAIEEVIAQPVMVEFDKVIKAKLEEAVISESVAYAKVIKEASLVLDTVW